VTYHRVDAGLARLLNLGLQHDLNEKVAGWKKNLDSQRLTTEMRDVFAAMGWLSSSRDSRLSRVEDDDEEETSGDWSDTDMSERAVPVPVREPEVKEDGVPKPSRDKG
jgi:hypothetical protein